MGQIYRIGSGEMKPVEDANLEIGQVFFLHGYGRKDRKVIYDTQKSPEGRLQYKWAGLDEAKMGITNAWEIRPFSEKFGIGLYYHEGDTVDSETITEVLAKAKEQKAIDDTKAIQGREQREKRENEGKKIFESICPSWAQAAIVAINEKDESDPMTDYFAARPVKEVLLGFSKHKKDLFSEMRKHADKLEETKHLSEYKKEYEHREKYSMGAGYYLKASNRYSTGWKIEKKPISEYTGQDFWQMCGNGNYIKPEEKKVEKPEEKTGSIQIVDYSEKAIAVTGDTKPFKDDLHALGGKFNFRLKCGPGWIFPKTKQEEVAEFVEKVNS